MRKTICIDSVENYAEAVQVHTGDDPQVDWKFVEAMEEKMNDHYRVFNRMFNVGTAYNNSNQDRISQASKSSNVPPPPLRIMRKDHKPVPPGQEDKGPPGRPVCAASSAPNSRFGHFVSMILTNYLDNDTDHHEVMSSEEMRAGLEEYNVKTPDEIKKNCVIFSMDVKALYPSLRTPSCCRAVKEMIMKSDLEMRNIDYWEACKYVSVFYSVEEIENEGLSNVIPKRKLKARRPLTINCLSAANSKLDDIKWNKCDTPDEFQ